MIMRPRSESKHMGALMRAAGAVPAGCIALVQAVPFHPQVSLRIGLLPPVFCRPPKMTRELRVESYATEGKRRAVGPAKNVRQEAPFQLAMLSVGDPPAAEMFPAAKSAGPDPSL